MITGFEKETHELNEYERNTVLPLLVSGLSRKVGRSQAITNKQMVAALKARGIKASGPRLRKIIHEIRIKGLVPYLIATSKGYYVSHDKQEVRDYIDSLHQRAESILEIAKQIEFQYRAL